MANESANAYVVRMRDTTMTKRAILEKFAFYRQLPKTDQLRKARRVPSQLCCQRAVSAVPITAGNPNEKERP